MRTTKRFTPQLLARFSHLGRGQGIFGDYIPWHRVSRSDPSSRGRSHLLKGDIRQHELLSDHEWVAIMFAFMLPNRVDIREQFPLSLEGGKHELESYRIGQGKTFPGTRAIAAQLGFKHPQTTEGQESAEWIMTTDLLIALHKNDGSLELLAVAVKPIDELGNKRKQALLTIEKEYWKARGITWLLITPALYDKKVGLCLRRQMPHILGERVPDQDRQIAARVSRDFLGRSLTFVLKQLEAALGDMDRAQRAFWQAVTRGEIPMSLQRSWRPDEPIQLLPAADFAAQNPIASRRSAWN